MEKACHVQLVMLFKSKLVLVYRPDNKIKKRVLFLVHIVFAFKMIKCLGLTHPDSQKCLNMQKFNLNFNWIQFTFLSKAQKARAWPLVQGDPPADDQLVNGGEREMRSTERTEISIRKSNNNLFSCTHRSVSYGISGAGDQSSTM